MPSSCLTGSRLSLAHLSHQSIFAGKMGDLVRSRHLENGDPKSTIYPDTVSSILAASTHPPPPPDVLPTSVFDKPIVKYFSITGILAFIALLALVIYYVISHIETKRALEADRKSYVCIQMPTPAGRRMSRPMINTDCDTSTNRGRYAFPFVWRLARRN